MMMMMMMMMEMMRRFSAHKQVNRLPIARSNHVCHRTTRCSSLDTKHLAGSLTAMPVGPTNWPAIYDHSSRPLFTPNTWARGFHMIGHRQFIPIYNHSPRPTELALSAAFGIPLPHKRAILIGIRSNELA